jgi:hypothetical protein
MQKLVALLSECDVISCNTLPPINIPPAALAVSGRNFVGAESLQNESYFLPICSSQIQQITSDFDVKIIISRWKIHCIIKFWYFLGRKYFLSE